jgi:hypothetical protein
MDSDKLNSLQGYPTQLFSTLKKNTYSYLLTPCSRVLLEKLIGFQPVKKLPEFYRT